MLMALSLAEKLGKRGLEAFSLHPGVIMGTSLGTHLEETSFQGLRMAPYPLCSWKYQTDLM